MNLIVFAWRKCSICTGTHSCAFFNRNSRNVQWNVLYSLTVFRMKLIPRLRVFYIWALPMGDHWNSSMECLTIYERHETSTTDWSKWIVLIWTEALLSIQIQNNPWKRIKTEKLEMNQLGYHRLAIERARWKLKNSVEEKHLQLSSSLVRFAHHAHYPKAHIVECTINMFRFMRLFIHFNCMGHLTFNRWFSYAYRCTV